MKGRLIVLEGIDGCGKTTQINHLLNWLPKSGLMPEDAKLYATREPGGTSLGNALRDLLLNPPGEKAPEPLTELLLYAADRAQHISQFIQPKLNNGDWIISDRLSGSTLAYQGYGRGLNQRTINLLEGIALQGVEPDLTILLNIPVEASLIRRGDKSNDRIEAEGYSFLKKVASGFIQIGIDRNWSEIPGHIDPDLVSQKIEQEIRKFVQEKNI